MMQSLDLSSFLSEIEQGKVSAFTGDLGFSSEGVSVLYPP